MSSLKKIALFGLLSLLIAGPAAAQESLMQQQEGVAVTEGAVPPASDMGVATKGAKAKHAKAKAHVAKAKKHAGHKKAHHKM